MTPALEVANLNKRFGGLPATKQVSLSVMPGERRLIIDTCFGAADRECARWADQFGLMLDPRFFDHPSDRLGLDNAKLHQKSVP